MRGTHNMASIPLSRFRQQYGRLCTLVAAALQQGHGQAQVTEAACGRGQGIAPVYVGLRNQRKRVNEALQDCLNADVPNDRIVQTAGDVRTAVEGEWQRRLPKMA